MNDARVSPLNDDKIPTRSATRKRFIAGAKCPQCGEMDRLVVYKEAGLDFRACVSCGFKERMRFPSAPAELETRVNSPGAESRTEPRPVKIIDPESS